MKIATDVYSSLELFKYHNHMIACNILIINILIFITNISPTILLRALGYIEQYNYKIGINWQYLDSLA